MDVYLIVPDSDTYDSLLPINSDDWDVFRQFVGKALARSWVPVSVQVLRAESSGEFPSLASHVPVFSERAWQTLQPLVGQGVEALPLESDSGRFYAINVLNLVSLDHSRSQVERLPSGDIMYIERYAFDIHELQGVHIFKVREAPLQRVLVSSDFKELVEKSDLKGLIFKKIE